MKKKKYLNGCWTKAFYFLAALCVFSLAFILYVNVEVEKMLERERMRSLNSQMIPLESLVTFAVRCQDSAYCVISSDVDLHNYLAKCSLDISQLGMSAYQLVHLWYHDTIDVDSVYFSALEKYKVIPQERIDFIYKRGGVPALVACFFRNDCYTDTTLTDNETRYLFDIMQRDSCRFIYDDESGFIYFLKKEKQ